MINREQYTPPTLPFIADISNDAYHESVGLSSSGIKLFMRSPLHYWDKYLNPEREKQERTPALLLGQQIHDAILEPEKYFANYYPLPEKFDRRTKAGKENAEYHEAQAAAKKQEVISADNHEICQKIAIGIREHPAASLLFGSAGLVEKSFYWQDAETGVLLKCRPDKLLPDFGVILDLKSCEDASPAKFAKQTVNYEYHIQAALYMRGVEAVTGERPDSFLFAAFEKSSPWACAFYEADSDMLEYGNSLIDSVLRRYAACLDSDYWPSYNEKIVKISLPAWAKQLPESDAI